MRYVVGSEERHVYTLSGENFLGQDSKTEILSLADAAVLDTLEITWPSGLVETYTNIPAGSQVQYTEGASLSANIVLEGEATGLCAGESVTLGVDLEGAVDWGEYGVSPTLEVTTSGTYQATVTTPLGFVVQTDPITIDVVNPVAYDDLVAGISCFGQVGGIALLVEDADQVATIDWNDGAYSTLTLNNIPAGTYAFTLTDSNGCVQTGSYTLTEPELLELAVTPFPVACAGEASGSVELDAWGGTPGYTFGETPATAGLEAGTYAYTVTDANNCTATVEVEITAPDPLEVSGSTTGSAVGDGAGTASVSVAGGTAPYTYLWSTGSTDASLENLEPGIYSVWVVDDAGCTWFELLEVEALVGITAAEVRDLAPYPNPMDDALFMGHSEPVRYRVVHTSGAVVSEGNWAPSTALDASAWAAGTYVLYLYDTPAGTLTRLLVRR